MAGRKKWRRREEKKEKRVSVCASSYMEAAVLSEQEGVGRTREISRAFNINLLLD